MTLHRFFAQVVVFLSRISAFFRDTQSLHHARFASLHELSPLITATFDKPGLLLGTSHFNQILLVRPTKTRRELGNTLVVAPPRSGKSVLATSELLTWPRSVVVNDVKGELFAATAGYRASLGKVFVIDPTGVGHCYDPLLGRNSEDELLSAATQLLYHPNEGEGAIFTQRAIVMLTQLFLAARAEGVPPLPYVRYMIRTGLQDTAVRLNAIDPDLATQFLDVRYEDANFDDRFLLSAWGTVTARMRPLLTETVIRSLSGSDFSPRDLMTANTPITVYLRWPERDLLALAPLVRLVWGTLIDELIATYDDAEGVNCQPVLLLIDEAGRTAIPSLADHATTVVGRGISLWVAVQSISQLDAVYGTTRAQIIKDDMDSQLFYKPADQKTAEYIERALGDKSGFAHSETKHEAHSSEGMSEQRIPVLTAWEIKHMTKRTEIFGFYNSNDALPPFRAQRMD
jgi:type IV secretion system protein VirD4